MKMEPDAKELAFRKFRPYCVGMFQTPNKEHLDKLEELVKTASTDELTTLQEYMIFPMQLYLKKPSQSENFTINVIDYVKIYFSRCRLDQFFILKDLLNAFLLLVSNKKGEEKQISEDLKLAITNCTTSLLNSATTDVTEKFMSDEMKLPISHLVFLTLNWTESEKSPAVRTSCLELLRTFITSTNVSRQAEKKFVNLFINLLPGILSKLVKVLQQASLVSVKALVVKTWSEYVSTIVNDKLSVSDQLNQEEALTVHDGALKDASISITSNWLSVAKVQILKQLNVLSQMSGMSGNLPDFRISSALLHMVKAILEKSWVILQPSHSEPLTALLSETNKESVGENTPEPSVSELLLRVLVTLSLSQLPEIREQAGQLTNVFIDKHARREEDASTSIQELAAQVNKKLLNLCKELSQCRGLYEAEKLGDCLLQLRGYMEFLHRIEAESVFFLSTIHVRLLVHNLIKISVLSDEVDLSYGGAEDFTSLDFLFSPVYYLTYDRPKKYFDNLNSQSSGLVSEICLLLGRMDSFHTIADYLLQGVEELDSYKREALFVLNEIVRGASQQKEKKNPEQFKQTCLMIMHNYLKISSKISSSSLVRIKDKDSHLSETSSRGGWTSQLLAVEGLGHLARLMGDSMRPYVCEVLIYVITAVDLTDRLAAHVLYFALADVATGMQKDKFSNTNSDLIANVIKENVDHLAKDLNLMLRCEEVHHPGLSTLIRLILKVSPVDQDQHDLLDTIQALALSLGNCKEEAATLHILNIVRIFVLAFRDRVKKIDSDSSKMGQDKRKLKGSITRMIRELENERKEDKKLLDSFNDCTSEDIQTQEDNLEDVMHENESVPEEDKETMDQKFLKVVIEHVRHFVPMTAKPAWQLAALDSVTCCIDFLSSTPGQQPGKNQVTILPLIHQTWLTLQILFKSKNIFVVDRAFDCLVVIALHARDFVHQRVVKEVFPSLINFFHMLDAIVKDRDRQHTMMANQARRILEKLVDGIWNFLHLLDLHPLESDPLIELLVLHMQDKLLERSLKPEEFFKPKRNVDANILRIKLHHGCGLR